MAVVDTLVEELDEVFLEEPEGTRDVLEECDAGLTITKVVPLTGLTDLMFCDMDVETGRESSPALSTSVFLFTGGSGTV